MTESIVFQDIVITWDYPEREETTTTPADYSYLDYIEGQCLDMGEHAD